MDERTEKINHAARYLKSCIGGEIPTIGIVLGSGLGKLADEIKNPTIIPYRDVPEFPVSTAIGHKGNFIYGDLGGKKIIAMQGRLHFYEGYPMELVTLGVRVMKLLGIEFLFVSNAAGGVNFDYHVGDLVIIKDHINMMPNPLIGPNLSDFGPRFPDMTCAYDLELQQLAERIGIQMGLNLRKGVYFGSTGPTYETPAEIRFFREVGADLVGMSTIPEVIVARHCGIRVFGMSVVTNEANTRNVPKNFNDGDDVVKQAGIAADNMSKLFRRMIEEL
ncbi:MAG: purine-nucleoside phosphorylase [Bacteroidales bacterium]|nr:purine-nucleoside phosphorylase [Bacteroidales bacterium]MBR0028939.1 purine-nucleoside phosphorylase [Bacteroidales bacterium]MBR0083852.1 purine-nucleoside phosphorylase [Bacteroidales bacterium]